MAEPTMLNEWIKPPRMVVNRRAVGCPVVPKHRVAKATADVSLPRHGTRGGRGDVTPGSVCSTMNSQMLPLGSLIWKWFSRPIDFPAGTTDRPSPFGDMRTARKGTASHSFGSRDRARRNGTS